jgi:prephenate dehydrogenase
MLSPSQVLRGLPRDALKGVLVVDVLNVKAHPKAALVELLPPEADVICTHPMFGPESGEAFFLHASPVGWGRGGWFRRDMR